jgi:exonuclease VII large subunit
MRDLLHRRIDQNNHRLLDVTANLRVNNPSLPLEKGYSRIWQEDSWIRSSNSLQPNKPIQIEWKDGRVSRN